MFKWLVATSIMVGTVLFPPAPLLAQDAPVPAGGDSQAATSGFAPIDAEPLTESRQEIADDEDTRGVTRRVGTAANYQTVTVAAKRPVRQNGEALGRNELTISTPAYAGIDVRVWACEDVPFARDRCFNGSTVTRRNWPGQGAWLVTARDSNSCRRDTRNHEFYTRVEIRTGTTVRGVAESPQYDELVTDLDCR